MFPCKKQFKVYSQYKRLDRTRVICSIVEGSSNVEQCINEIKNISTRDISKIEECTKGQHKNILWMRCRKHTITASIAHRLNNAFKKGDIRFRVRALVAKETHIPKYIPALIYGQEMEEYAIEAFLKENRPKHVNLRCMNMGLRLYEKAPMLGASVDGIIKCDCHDEQTIIEIKSPYSLRGESILAEGRKLPYFTDNLKLKTSHPHYTQIQFGMGVFNIKNALFIVWSEIDFVVNDIEFDKEFFENLVCNLSMYYNQCYLPRLF